MIPDMNENVIFSVSMKRENQWRIDQYCCQLGVSRSAFLTASANLVISMLAKNASAHLENSVLKEACDNANKENS